MAHLFSKARVNLSSANRFMKKSFSTTTSSMEQAYKTIRYHPNNGLKYAGAAGATALGMYVAYSLSRPTSYVSGDTRLLMHNMGGSDYSNLVRNRIFKTYAYLTGSVLLTGATTFMLLSRGMLGRVLSFNPLIFGLGTLACTWGAIAVTLNAQSPGMKHAAWMATNGLVGLSILGLCGIAGGAIVQQAALITGIIVGSMSFAAMAAPNDTFLSMGPYLGVCLGVVIAASLGGMFFPTSTMLMNVSLYGGLGLFGLFAAHDTQRVLHNAQTDEHFDPINNQMGLYLDSINIFVRIVQILMLQQSRRK